MKPAQEFQVVRPGVCFWQNYEPAVKCDLTSTAIQVGQGLIFIDPIPLASDALDELIALAVPKLIVLTNGNHARAAAMMKERFSIPIAAHPEAAANLGLFIDLELREGVDAAQGFEVVELPGAGAGEIALLADGALLIGDALIHLEPDGLRILPDKYCLDAKTLRLALEKLLRFEWQLLTFAHGLPLVSNARRKLESLLA